jgi:hypothetical protein
MEGYLRNFRFMNNKTTVSISYIKTISNDQKKAERLRGTVPATTEER